MIDINTSTPQYHSNVIEGTLLRSTDSAQLYTGCQTITQHTQCKSLHHKGCSDL